MSSFLQKLRGKGIVQTEEAAESAGQVGTPVGVAQLPVDVYQSDREIVIYAQIPGTDVSKLDVSIEGENDVITVQGEQRRPEELGAASFSNNDESENNENRATDGEEVPIHIGSPKIDTAGEFSFEECIWGQFFRQIILPQEVDPGRALAKVKDGVLVLHLPLKEVSDNRIKMKIVKMDNQ